MRIVRELQPNRDNLDEDREHGSNVFALNNLSLSKWSGHYEYDGQKHYMSFQNLQIEGRKISGAGSDDVGEFTIEGTVIEGAAKFEK